MTGDLITENTTEQQREMTALLTFNAYLKLIANNEALLDALDSILWDIECGTREPDTSYVNDAFIAAWRKHGRK